MYLINYDIAKYRSANRQISPVLNLIRQSRNYITQGKEAE